MKYCFHPMTMSLIRAMSSAQSNILRQKSSTCIPTCTAEFGVYLKTHIKYQHARFCTALMQLNSLCPHIVVACYITCDTRALYNFPKTLCGMPPNALCLSIRSPSDWCAALAMDSTICSTSKCSFRYRRPR